MGNTESAGSGISALPLPERAVLKIAKLLSAKDIARVARCSKLLHKVSADNKIWRVKCLDEDWGGRETSVHAMRKKWRDVYIQMVMLHKQKALQYEVAKTSYLRGPRKTHMLLLGLDQAGKTSFLYRLKLGRKIVSIPTVGANREAIVRTIAARNQQVERKIKVTDVGGITPMRSLWPEYLRRDSKIDVLVFVVDASDPSRLAMASQELGNCVKVLKDAKPVLILGSKFDVPRALSAHQLVKKLRLHDIFATLKKPPLWCCQSVSNVSGQGLEAAMEWVNWAVGNSPLSKEECWFCRHQDVDEEDLVKCQSCSHPHCRNCLAQTGSSSLCKFCYYCRR